MRKKKTQDLDQVKYIKNEDGKVLMERHILDKNEKLNSINS